MKTREDLLSEARKLVKEWPPKEVQDRLQGEGRLQLLDVRGLDEWDRGHLKGAVHIPRGRMEAEVEARLPDKRAPVVVYCAGGVRSLLAAQALSGLGYERVISMSGGFGDWADEGLPVEKPPMPEDEEGPADPELLRQEIAHLEEKLAARRRKLEATAR